MSGGGKTSTSTSSVQIPPEVMARYNAVNQYASKVAETPYQPYQGQFVAPMTSTQNAAVANVNQAAGQAQPYFTGATESLLQGQQAATPYYGAAMDVYGGAYGLGAQLGQESYGALQGAQAAAQPYNQAATGLAAAGTQAVNPTYLGQGAINQYMSPYLNNVVGATMQAMNQQNQEQQSQLTSDAIKSGAFGGDRSGVAAANLAYKQNLANQQTLANLYNTGYGQALGTAQQQQGVGLGAQQANRAALQAGAGQMMGIGQQQFGQGATAAGQLAGLGQQQFGQGLAAGQQIAGLGQGVYGMGEKTAQNLAALGTGAQGAALQGASAQLAAGTQEQQTQQAQNAAFYNQFLQQQGYPFQTAQFLANIAMGTGANSGSTTTTTQPTSFFSDKRLKENVHQVGETFDGQPIYRYNYKGQRGTQIGLIAQDVERKRPEAVGVAGGYKTVDYDRATEDAAHRGHFAYGGASMGGGVVPERAGEGFAFGGMVDKPFMSDNYFTHILNRVHGTPIGAGLGGQTQGLNIPQGNMSPGRLAVASPPPAQTSTGEDYRHFAENIKAGKTLVDAGTGLYKSIFGAAHGGAIRGYADGGEANDEDASPYGVRSFVPNEKPNIPALKTAPAGPGHSGGLGSDIMDVAKFGSSIAGLASLFGLSDKRLKENIHQIGKTFDGQPVYRYNYKGHPETQIGLIAQDVEHKHPEAVGLAGGYKTVDYGRATEGAAHRGHFAYGGSSMGGVMPRHGFQVGGAPVEGDDVNRLLRPEWRQRQYDRSEAEGRAGLAPPSVRQLEVAPDEYDPMGNRTGYSSNPPASLASSSQNVTPQSQNQVDTLSGDITKPTLWNFLRNPLGSAQDWLYQSRREATPSGRGLNPTPPSISDEPPPPEVGRYSDLVNRVELEAANQPPAAGVVPSGRQAPPAAGVVPSGRQAPRLGRDQSVGPHPLTPGGALADAPSVATPPVGQGAVQQSAPVVGGLSAARPEKADEGSGGSWFSRNQDWLVPLLTGVGTMAASPSRYLGSALAQGLAGAAGSYGNVQTQMAQRAKTYADTTRQLAEASRYNYNPDTGLFSAWDNGVFRQIPFKEFFERVKAKDPNLSLVHPETNQYPNSVASSQYVPPTPSAQINQGAGISSVAQQSVSNEIARLSNVPPNQAAAFSTPPDYKQIQAGSSSSVASKTQINELIKNLQTSPAGGPITSQYFMPIAQKANDILRGVGLPEISPETLASSEAVQKLSAEFAAQMQRSGNSRAAAEFTSLLSTLPTNANSPEGKKKLSASILVNNQRAIDMQNFATAYKDEAIRQGITPVLLPHVGSNLNDAFDKEFSQQYQSDVNNLENMYANTIRVNGKPVNTMQFLMDHAKELSLPENARLREYLEGLYGKTLRYF